MSSVNCRPYSFRASVIGVLEMAFVDRNTRDVFVTGFPVDDSAASA